MIAGNRSVKITLIMSMVVLGKRVKAKAYHLYIYGLSMILYQSDSSQDLID